MEGRAKVTKEVLCEEARFILANVMAEARYGRQNRYDDIRRVCEGAVSIPFAEYIGFLEKSGYLRHDRANESLEVSPEGETVVNGGNLQEFTERAVSHFKKLRQSRAMAVPTRRDSDGHAVRRDAARPLPRDMRNEGSAARALPVKDSKVSSTGGRPTVGGRRGEMSSTDEQRYEKLASIGSGGMGTVYRARQIALNREVALKEIRDLFGFFSEDQRNEIVRRFTDVVRAWGNLAHPNILPIHDVNIWVEYPNVVTELAPNGSARRLINDAEDIPVELAFKYLLQTLHALRAASRTARLSPRPQAGAAADRRVRQRQGLGLRLHADRRARSRGDPPDLRRHGQRRVHGAGALHRSDGGRPAGRHLRARHHLLRAVDAEAAGPALADAVADQPVAAARHRRHLRSDDARREERALRDGRRHPRRHRQARGHGGGARPPEPGARRARARSQSIKFRPGAEEPLAGTPVEGEEGDDKKAGHRPYSFQQRRKKI